jgi:uncharacterized protein involved in exopolysaccharide biosynthesis
LALPDDDYRLFDVLRQLTARWRFLAVTTIATGAALLGIAALRTPRYTATATVALAQQRLAGGVGGVARVLRSRSIAERLLRARFADPSPEAAPGDSATLFTLLELGSSRPDSLERGVRRLAKRIQARLDNETRTVDVSVWDHSPVLAAAVANRMVAYLNEFNAQELGAEAHERSTVAQGRIDEVKHELREAEDRLRQFHQTHPSWQRSTALTFEETQLQRQLEMSQELYISLRVEYQAARVELTNVAADLTLIDAAVPPTRRSSPRPGRALLIGLALGLFGGVLWVLGGDYWKKAREGI